MHMGPGYQQELGEDLINGLHWCIESVSVYQCCLHGLQPYTTLLHGRVGWLLSIYN